jgi:hypothetical protein
MSSSASVERARRYRFALADRLTTGGSKNDELEDLSRQDRDCLARRFPLGAVEVRARAGGATADGTGLAPAGIVDPALLFKPDVTLDTLETAPVVTEL